MVSWDFWGGHGFNRTSWEYQYSNICVLGGTFMVNTWVFPQTSRDVLGFPMSSLWSLMVEPLKSLGVESWSSLRWGHDTALEFSGTKFAVCGVCIGRNPSMMAYIDFTKSESWTNILVWVTKGCPTTSPLSMGSPCASRGSETKANTTGPKSSLVRTI